MKWDEMNERERDALVAEKVMGFQWGDIGNGNDGLMPPYHEYPWCLTSLHVYGTDGYHTGMPHYTTDISAAWEVVEEMRSNGYDVQLTTCDSGFCCEFEDPLGICKYGECPLAPEAICLAALRAMGVDI